jgi:DNA-binding IclR family transcriptional regulator
VTDDQVFSFARNTIRSVWALELLLLLHRHPARRWSSAELVRELRSSEAVLLPCLETLKAAGLVGEEEKGRFGYIAANPELDAMTEGLARIYATSPIALAKAIMRAPNEKLALFSDAFKFRDDK